ncbi:MAG: histidine phosphatase family protein [Dehalococcoidia bacterium]|nr:histidine phosphatase family protein [Dehalococcoidia bacterium]
MSGVILVRHALPEVVHGASPASWGLSQRGREDGVLLAHALAGRVDPLVYSSTEPKARQTADVIALRLGLRAVEDARFGEIERPLAWAANHGDLVRRYLDGEEHAGWEPRGDAIARFGAAVAQARRSGGDGDIAIATHGTVMTLWAAAITEMADPAAWWASLTFPDAWRIDPDEGSMEHLFNGGTPGG